jgi:transcription initiation factor TFIID subunit 2
MDLETLENNMNSGKYTTMDQFYRDMLLIFKNCRKFNGPLSSVTAAGDSLEQLFKSEWNKALRMSSAEKAMINKIISSLMQED